MAYAATTIIECQVGGNDTNNGALFDPGKVAAGGWTDGAATVATGNSPVFTSASYSFVAGDVGAWLYITSGTNWIPGWYQIASVAGGAATLTASIGSAVLAGNVGMNTVAGCATTASPTGATWAIDYSQQSTAEVSYTDLVSAGAGLTVSSATSPFGRHQVGNGLVITSGTNFNTGRYVIASVAAVTFIATVVGPTNITTGAGVSGVGGLGGAMVSPSIAVSIIVAAMFVFCKYNASPFAVTSASTSTAGGCLANTLSHSLIGYNTSRTLKNTDANRPTIQAQSISTFTMYLLAGQDTNIRNIIWDAQSLTSARGFNGSSRVRAYNCKFMNFTNMAVLGAITCVQCEFVGHTLIEATNGILGYDCEAHGGTSPGFKNYASLTRCYAYNNTGASSHGFVISLPTNNAINCVAYNNGGDGFNITTVNSTHIGCISENNGGWGFNVSTGNFGTLLNCATYNNTSGSVSSASIDPLSSVIANTTGSFFTAAGSGDFSLNNLANQGALLRAACAVFNTIPTGTTLGYLDIGAAQHQDSPSTTTIFALND